MSPSLSGDGSRFCAQCHPGGGTNGKVYRAGIEVAPGSEGGRDVPELRGLWQSAPYLWDGSLGSVTEVIDRMLAVEMGGGRIGELDRRALETYLLSIPAFDNGRIQPDGAPVEPATLSARRGFGVFLRVECDTCHPPPSYTHRFRFDVGTGAKWSVPSLRNVSRTAPLGHDGRWPDLETAVAHILRSREIELDSRELRYLLRYLELL